mgnify:CR=1 FL=1
MLGKNTYLFFLICILLFSSLMNYCFLDLNVKAAPLWFRKGIYVEFRNEKDALVFAEFINGSILTCEKLGLKAEKRKTLFIYRWECLDFSDNLAKLKITIEFILVEENISLNISTCVFVDVNSRDVYSVNGTPCGKTTLWLSTKLKVGDTVLFGYPGCYVEGEVTDMGYALKTPYGYQKCFEVEFDTGGYVGVTYGNKTYNWVLWNWLDYDLDTGILLQTPNFMGEATLYVLGILQIPAIMLIYETNVDLGPSLIWPQILNITFFVLPPAVFFTVVFLCGLLAS